MGAIGIIAEYNPFHSGHSHHLRQVREAFGPEAPIVCAMSGHWVQRGEAALADKWTRAGIALGHGADLVLELPTLWAAASAETFARGGVGLLAATGVVDTLSFGSEAGDLAPLRQAAHCLGSEAWRALLREGLDRGLPFPAARQQAAQALLGPAADCLKGPNNNLGVEYLRAMEDLGCTMAAHTIPRAGAGHDTQEGDALHVSASYLRGQLLQQDPPSLSPYLAPEEQGLLETDPASLAFCTQGVLARLRGMAAEDFARLPDSGEGLDKKLSAAVAAATSLPQLYGLVKSKRYTHARIRRLVLWAFLGLEAAHRPAALPYLRVLGFSPRGQRLLKEMKATASLPVLVKPAHAAKLPPAAREIFAQEARSTQLYDLCRKNFGVFPGKNEYTQTPVRV